MSRPSSTPADISVALSPCDFDSVPGLVNKIMSLSQGLTKDDVGQRLQLLAEARALVNALETPRETFIKHLWAEVCYILTPSALKNADLSQPTSSAALAVAVDSGALEYMAKDSETPKTTDAIASAIGADAAFMGK